MRLPKAITSLWSASSIAILLCFWSTEFATSATNSETIFETGNQREPNCLTYQTYFPEGDIALYASGLFEHGPAALKPRHEAEWAKLRGHENPYVYLVSSYYHLSQEDTASALLGLELAARLMRDIEPICQAEVFWEFLLAARIEAISQIDRNVGLVFFDAAFPLMKGDSTNRLSDFQSYSCAISKYNLAFDKDFLRC